MSALTDRIAAEHDTYLTYLTGGDLRASCEGCDWTFEGDSIDAVVECSRHVAAVTEAAMRERVARDIEYAESMSRASLIERPKIGPGEFLNDWQWAARIARGGAA